MSERLEEIKANVWKDPCTYAEGDDEDRKGYSYTLSDYDYAWLIQQAERVEELENEYQVRRTELLEEHIDRLQEQNQRYKQALEEIADETYIFTNPNYKEEYEACLEIARKALEEAK